MCLLQLLGQLLRLPALLQHQAAPPPHVIGQGGSVQRHESTLPAPGGPLARQPPPTGPGESICRSYPASSGRQVRRGIRQSIPPTSIASCAGVTTTWPSAGDGHTNRPFSSRLENRQRPWPSHHSTLRGSPRRPRNTNRWPEKGSSRSVSWTCRARPSKPLRMSVLPAASHTLTPLGVGSIGGPAPAARAPVPSRRPAGSSGGGCPTAAPPQSGCRSRQDRKSTRMNSSNQH